jgi:hypothetical protein
LAISGTGRYLADATGGSLEVFTAGNSSDPSAYPPPSADLTTPGCDAVLAWAPELDRIACGQATGGSDGQAQIALFDVTTDANGTTTTPASLVHGVSGFPNLFPSGRQRLFSRDGNRFAFTTATGLSVAQTNSGASAVIMHHEYNPAPGADDAVVAFSPTGNLIAEHRGNHLGIFDVGDSTGHETPLDNELPPAQACQDGARAAASVSCGGERAAAAFAWSHDDAMIAHATTAGELFVIDLARFDHTEVTFSCGSCLSGESFAFQP